MGDRDATTGPTIEHKRYIRMIRVEEAKKEGDALCEYPEEAFGYEHPYPSLEIELGDDGLTGEECQNCGHVHLPGGYPWVPVADGACCPEDRLPLVLVEGDDFGSPSFVEVK